MTEKPEGTKPTVTIPPPEKTATITVRIYEADKDLLQDVYGPSGGMSTPVRRIIRRLADQHRKSLGWPLRGQPGETRKPGTDI